MNWTRCLPASCLIAWLISGSVHTLQLTNEDPDALWTNREEFPSAMRALEIWDRRLKADPKDFESAWKLARACYWIRPRVSGRDADRERTRGIDAARRAIKLRNNSPEGHFWFALNLGVLRETFNWESALKEGFVTIERALKAVIKANPGFENGAAHVALGRLHGKTPSFFGGSKTKAEESLRRALDVDSENALALFFLAEFLIDRDRHTEARTTLERLIAAQVRPQWAPESRELQDRASRLVQTLK